MINALTTSIGSSSLDQRYEKKSQGGISDLNRLRDTWLAISDISLTCRDLVMHIYVGELGQDCLGKWFVVWSAQGHYLPNDDLSSIGPTLSKKIIEIFISMDRYSLYKIHMKCRLNNDNHLVQSFHDTHRCHTHITDEFKKGTHSYTGKYNSLLWILYIHIWHEKTIPLHLLF